LTQGPGSPIIKIKIPDSEGIALGIHNENYILFAKWKPNIVCYETGINFPFAINSQFRQKQGLCQFQFEITLEA
jgi:hypothetical protein